MAKRNRKKAKSNAKATTSVKSAKTKKPDAEVEPEKTEEVEEGKSDYVSPEFVTAADEDGKGGEIAKALAAAEKALGAGGPLVTAQFEKVDKAEFGYSVGGKKDFCRHQIALYLARLAELIAEDSPEQKAAKKLARLKSAQDKRQKEIDELEKAAK